MSDRIITVERLSKRYRIEHQSGEAPRYTSFRDVLTRRTQEIANNALGFLRGRPMIRTPVAEEFWALRDVSFEVKRGEVVGIIGRNGAGKSTLLKILSRITEPTEGRITLRGRVASLLEVGTGFHPELTGRENIFLNGAMLGMSQREIRRKFDAIVAFADVDRFLDTPVKRFSSGMYVRLAFAVAAHLEPEILIVDEVLAVGDAEFQRKCLGKIDEVSRREGRTVLFVSHNMGVVSTLCPSAIWLDRGSVRRQGPTQQVINDYLGTGLPDQHETVLLEHIPRRDSTDGRLRLVSLEWLSKLPLQQGEAVKGRIHFRTRAPLRDVTVGIGFTSIGGTRLLTYATDFQDGWQSEFQSEGDYWVDFELQALPLAPDIYAVDIGCGLGELASMDRVPAAAQVEVVAGPRAVGSCSQNGAGVYLPSHWERNRSAGTGNPSATPFRDARGSPGALPT